MTSPTLRSPTSSPLSSRTSPSPSPLSSSGLSSSSSLILWYCIVSSCVMVVVLWARCYRLRNQRRQQEAMLEMARNIMRSRMAGDVERRRRANDDEDDGTNDRVRVSSDESDDNLELLERALFGPDETDDIFITARSALALSSAAASIVEANDNNRGRRRRNRHSSTIDIEASVRVAHQILDSFEAEHRRRKKEKYIKLCRALGRTTMIVQECQLIHDSDSEDKAVPFEDENVNLSLSSERDTTSIQEEESGHENQFSVTDIDDQRIRSELVGKKSIIADSSVLTSNESVDLCPSMDDEDESKHTILRVPLCANSVQDNLMTTLSSSITNTSMPGTTIPQLCRNVPSTCAICLVQYRPGTHVSWSSNEDCRHVFHRDCILLWLLKKSGGHESDGVSRIDRRYLCPCCRGEFVSESILFMSNSNTSTTVNRE